MRKTTIRKAFRRAGALILAFVLVLPILVGCRSGNNAGVPTDSGSALTSGGETTAEPVDISKPRHYQALFNSDTTHIEQCASPYHKTNQDTPLTKKMVQAAVTEALDAGADCYVITPGHCWTPWWPSEYLAAHNKWYFDAFGGSNTGNPFWTYIHVKKNDFIQQQIDVCRERGAGVFIDFRMNDAHMVGQTDPKKASIAFAAEIFVDHPEYRIGSMSDGTRENVLDFRHAAVREQKLNLIRELIERYEIDGFELDFCRRFAFFNTDKTTESERIAIMTDFVRQVREMLDRATERDGRYRDLSVRIPIWSDQYGRMGIDLAAFESAGVTIFNFTSSYFLSQDFYLEPLKAQLEHAKVYCELNPITAYSTDEDGKRIHRRALPEQYATVARKAYAQGADGLSFFNFQYYRGDRQGKGDEPLTEPPWEVIELVKDRDRVKKSAQYYWYGQTWRDLVTTSWKLPKTLVAGFRNDFSMYLTVPEDGWSSDGVFRVQSLDELSEREFTVTVNGKTLERIPYSGEAYPNPYTQMRGTAENYACFRVPKALLRAGENRIEVTLVSGRSVELCFVDLTVQ